MTKTEILEGWDRAMQSGRVRYPLRNVRYDAQGGFCALGVLDSENRDYVLALGELPSKLPSALRSLCGEEAVHLSEEGNIYGSGSLSDTLASVFNRTLSFAEARAWLDKELTRLVSEGKLSE